MDNGMDPEHRFAVSLMKHLVVPTFVLDTEGRVIIWNDACERLTGVKADDVIGTTNHRRAFYDQSRPCLADLIVMGRTDEIDSLYADFERTSIFDHVFHAENWCVMPNVNKRLYLHIDSGPIYDHDGQLIAVVETLRDMTAQKTAQLKLERLASSDGLTGLANRRVFDETLEAEWRRAQRAGYAISVLMIDVDHFKRYNDAFGHQHGDQCLRRVASVLAESMSRAGDTVARYGGEEFVVILPATQKPGALEVAERIRAAVEALQMTHAGEEDEVVTVSIGVATSNAMIDSPITLVASADDALYCAKEAGRNRVEGFLE